MAITQERLKDILHYDPDTGVFTWLVNKGRAKAGSVAGSNHINHDGYASRQIKIDGKMFVASRLAWLYVYGQKPSIEIDHRDNDHTNNSLDNLRESSRQQNNANKRKYKTNKSGYKGVHQYRDKWIARISFDKRQYYLGIFLTKEEAYSEYCKKNTELNGEFANAM